MAQFVKGKLDDYTPKFKTPPKLQKIYIIGENDRFPTRVKIYVQGATLQYPDVAIKIAFQNGKGSVFATVNLEELVALDAFLNDSIKAVSQILPQLYVEEQAVRGAVENSFKTQQLLENLGASGVSPEQLQQAIQATQPGV